MNAPLASPAGLPGEAVLAAAPESAPTPFDNAVRERTPVCTPTTFVAPVRAAAHGRRRQTLAGVARAVVAPARDPCGRVGAFGVRMHDLGRAPGRAVDRYGKGVGAPESRVLPAARKFETPGVTPLAASLSRIAPAERAARELRAPEPVAPEPVAPEPVAPEPVAPEPVAEDECRTD